MLTFNITVLLLASSFITRYSSQNIWTWNSHPITTITHFITKHLWI